MTRLDLQGRTMLVTGATAGIGQETARALVRRGARVGIVARDEAKGRATRERLLEERAGAEVELFLCDFAEFAQIRALADEVRARFPVLHVLVNNAGAVFGTRSETKDGFERTFGVNHLGYYLLTRLLLEQLRASAPARIVCVASDAHVRGRMRWDDLQFAQSYSGFDAYSQSKLANVLFTLELARRLERSGVRAVTANCLHPGVVATEFGKHDGGLLGFLIQAARPLLIGASEGAATSIHLAAEAEVEGVSGRYFKRCREAPPSARARSEEDAARLWTLSAELCGLPEAL